MLGVYYVNGFHGLVPEEFFDLSGVLGIYYLTGANQSVPEGFSAPTLVVSESAAASAMAVAKAEAEANANPPMRVVNDEIEDTAPPLSLDKRLTDFVDSIKNTNMIVPTDTQLGSIQGNDTGYLGKDMGSGYKPHQEVIKPHMTPRTVNQTATGKVASDNGTHAEAIRENEVLTPSVREMLRDDSKQNSFNNNEISY